MDPLENLSALLDDPAFQDKVFNSVREEARQHNTSLTYMNEAGDVLKEYPATGEIYVLTFNPRKETLLSVHGVPVG